MIGKFFKYNMFDSKAIVKRVEELQVIIHELYAEGCSIDEQF